MNTKEAIKLSLASTQDLLKRYLTDLSDSDLLVRPVPGANHIAWQLGHLIKSEREFFGSFLPNANYPPLPAGFADQHNSANSKSDSTQGFLKKEEYLNLSNAVRQATIAAVDKLSDADFDRATTGDMAKFAPNLGAILLLTSNHTLMHAGQFTVVRRKLGKPIVM
jgi:uncharacterized damage-inducible protein DinB